jgi:hypothetical protein
LVAAWAQEAQQLANGCVVQLRRWQLWCWVAAAGACRAAAVHAAAGQHLLLCSVRPVSNATAEEINELAMHADNHMQCHFI